jgi:hypothetical protein
MRTDSEILDRYRSVQDHDVLGFKADILLSSLTAKGAQASGLFKPDASFDHWKPTTDASLRADLESYMRFAWGKVEDHRGISASRSVDKIMEMAWLLGRDDVVQVIEDAAYEQYGAPKLAAACSLLGLPIPDDEGTQNMIRSLPCHPCCEEGCGR